MAEGFRTCIVCRVEYKESTLIDSMLFEEALRACLLNSIVTIGI